jgi:DNA-binding transcriptional regulator LsrR (DeoR family)
VREVIVVDARNSEGKTAIAKAAARYLERTLKKTDIVGIGWSYFISRCWKCTGNCFSFGGILMLKSVDDAHITSEEEVWETVELIKPKLRRVIEALLSNLG